MRERLTLQRNTLGASSTADDGFKVHGWSSYATGVEAEYEEPPTGAEAFEGAAVTAELPLSFRIRYRPDVLPKHRVLWRGSELQIIAVIPVMRTGNRFLRLRCSLTQ
jgi:SPP1 family predicted phage head-tail adaptor